MCSITFSPFRNGSQIVESSSPCTIAPSMTSFCLLVLQPHFVVSRFQTVVSTIEDDQYNSSIKALLVNIKNPMNYKSMEMASTHSTSMSFHVFPPIHDSLTYPKCFWMISSTLGIRKLIGFGKFATHCLIAAISSSY